MDLHVSGLRCAACVWALEQVPRVLPGVRLLRVDFGASRMRLAWDPALTSAARIAEFLQRLGYGTHTLSTAAEDARRRERRREILRIGVAGAVATNVMLLAFALYAGADRAGDAASQGTVSLLRIASLVCTLPAVAWAAAPFHRGALAGLRTRTLHMDLPVSLGLLAGYAGSAWAVFAGRGEIYFDTLAVLVFLLLLGRRVQTWGQERAATAGELMSAVAPGTVLRARGACVERVPVGRIAAGDVVLAKAGDVLGVDGVVSTGRARIDVAVLTGESRPVVAVAGTEVFAGTRVVDGELRVDPRAWGLRSRIGRIVGQLERAGLERAPVVRLADHIAAWFVAAVLVAATVAGLSWWSIAASRTFDVVLSLLVVSCPCALGLATPLALSVARGRAARTGIWVKSPAALETLGTLRRVVLDKTGTLTAGVPRLMFHNLPTHLRATVAAVEAGSDHPLARTLVEALAPSDGDLPAVEDRQLEPGRGVSGRVAGRRVRLGSTAWLPEAAARHRDDVARCLALGATPILVEVEGVPAGCLGVGDELRPEAPAVVERLRRAGLELVIRSGDHPEIVAAVAARLGISDARGDVAPEDKVLAARAPRTAMVGDGVNDAPAMRAAMVGIAVSGGAEAAMRVCDVYLTRAGLGPLVDLLQGAARTRSLVRRNLALSLVYNLAFGAAAAAGLVTPLAAAVLMPLSSLTVVGSSVLGRSFPPLRTERDAPPAVQAWGEPAPAK
jgi:Cu2+-exporting ATPase